MKTIKQPLRAVLAATLSGFICMIHLPAVAKTPEPSGLFSSSSEHAKGVLPKHALKGKSRNVRINHRKLREGRFFVSLPDGVSYEAVRDLKQDQNKGRYAWVGHAGDDRRNRVVIGVSGDAVAGTFSYNGKLFRLEPRANGDHILSEVLPTDPAPELDPIPVSDTPLAVPDGNDYIAAAADTNGAVVDVLVAYTPAVTSRYGANGAEALVLQAVAEANQAYANSGMKMRLNLVHSTQTNYSESGSMNTDLSRLRIANDGYMDEIHSLRDQYGADLVSLIEDEPAYCGLAYRMATLSTSFASSAFSVVHHGCATGYYSFAHELGHNQGAHHDSGNASGTALFSYAYGYQDPNSSFRTIMAYNCPGGCTRISHFSNSNILYNGRPTGYPYYTENAYALENSAAVVASFRQAPKEVAPPSPSDLSGAAKGPEQVELAWTDTASNEKGFLLERSSDGLSYTQIASLAANTSTYRDADLQADALYYYRVRAWNSGGNSGYSNISAIATDPMPQYVDQFAQTELSLSSAIIGSLKDTMSQDNRVEAITEATSSGDSAQRYSYLEHYWSFNVVKGETITVYGNVTTNSASQTFTFAYSTTPVGLAANSKAWIDMFTVSAQTSGPLQFNLPANLSGPVYISVRDNQRVKGTSTADMLNVDYLAIRTSTTKSSIDDNLHLDQFAQTELSLSSAVTGSLADTMSQDNYVESITEATSSGDPGQRYSYLEHYWSFDVVKGEAISVHANVTTNSASQSFTFAYSTTPVGLAANSKAWVDMFTVSAQALGTLQFNLPATLSGPVYISVRDNQRVKGALTADTLDIDYLAIRTSTGKSSDDDNLNPAPSTPFDLTASGSQGKIRQKIELTWSGAVSDNVDIFRDGILVRDAATNDGAYRDRIESTASATYTYEVCEAGTNTCSNAAVVSF